MGPLSGYHFVEIAGIGPTQHCGMLLADMGASVTRVSRTHAGDGILPIPEKYQLLNRGRTTVSIDLKSENGRQQLLQLVKDADGLYEGFRPGVMERLELGPAECFAVNPRLAYGRMTGWGQEGPLAGTAGHDINYLALSGALDAIGKEGEPPVVPLNLIADFGGGGAYLAIGLLAAVLEAARSGRGQVVDTAMVDGVASLTTPFHGLLQAGLWRERRESNALDGGAPFYRCYDTRDARSVAVGALEPQFFAELLEILSINNFDPRRQFDEGAWPELADTLAACFVAKDRDEWAEIFAASDACVTPVLSMTEATQHPHNQHRETFVEIDGVRQPAAAPRFVPAPPSADADKES